MARYLRTPSTLILLATNMVPLVGVIFWDWDAFVLLMLYWLETAVIAFWTVVRIATMPRAELDDIQIKDSAGRSAAPLPLAAFFTLHAGIFMGIHFLFLWEMFADDWARTIHGVRDFVDQIIVGTGLWAPLFLLFVGRGLLVMYESLRPHLPRLLGRASARADPHRASTLSPGETLLFGLYIRIFVMQLTIIVGAWFAILVGTPGAFAFLIAVKTAIDISIQLVLERIHRAWIEAKLKAAASSPT